MKLILLLALVSVTLAQHVGRRLHGQCFDIQKHMRRFRTKFEFIDREKAFDEFCSVYQKRYFQPGERENRKRIFAQTAATVMAHNDKKPKFTQAVNKFSDMEFSEWAKKYLNQNLEKMVKLEFDKEPNKFSVGRHGGRRGIMKGRRTHKTDGRRLQLTKRSVSWKRYCSVVKDQIRCAACYAFAAVAGYETARNIYRRTISTFSEQSMIDCVTTNNGCTSGAPSRVLRYIRESGIARSFAYPYAGVTQQCQMSSVSRSNIINAWIGYSYLSYGIMSLLAALQYGPVILCQTVNQDYRSYRSGVFDTSNCNDKLVHSTLAVGYDLDAPIPYILVKNSWGDDWGDAGYIKMAIGQMSDSNGGLCRMASHTYNLELDYSE